ncbi:molybdenum ABC transporter substrate-binding protein [Enterococcus silesiacus]|uniref:Molybdenum ABC transporter substrate-binding protein n=1 Tax=Enterococcus silesiacus TaxID=332949 RepID=A0A0S3K774_9ENTE|nr:DUF975 family protein [Enterococcus silesiacus]ALR99944.1 molybdenum ABC transporter substrate-binding protein [Enterococcus silesiacus]OJG92747.1 hypothetical protein RV15_GL002692 [Enterococcus silesiacus]
MKTRAELKSEAKGILRGRWKDSLLMCLVPTLVSIAIALLLFFLLIIPIITFTQNNPDILNSTADYEGNSGGGGGSFVGGIIGAIFSAGISWTFLDLYRGKRQEIRPFSDAFRGFAGPVVLGIIGIFVLMSIFITLWSLLLIIPGIIKGYSYSQTYFVFYDAYEETGVRPGFLNSITRSRQLMKGYKGQLFLLDLSFIGWHILALLTLGIGYLWLTPYITATKAAFYENLPKTTTV